ncbi:Fic family protein [Mollicutes bacterium LVI A0039]|nr:Fic family protein [Mollicutes bacterium LVI A0039]
MQLVKIDSLYLKYYNEINSTTIKEFGVLVYNGEYKLSIFIPITSYKKKHSDIKRHDSKYHVLRDDKPKAVLKISDYIIIGKYSTLFNIENETIEQKEFDLIKLDIYVISKKLNDVLKANNKRLENRRSLYENYERNNYAATKKFSKNYIVEILYSISLFENLNVTPKGIESIINLSSETIKISGHDNAILNSAIESWYWVLDTLSQPITLEYIIDINRRIAKHQALKVGTLRDGAGGFVHGSNFNPPIPERNQVEKKIEAYLKKNNKLIGALEYFCYATKYQLFYDGNKRTSYLIVNKVLIENGIGVFYIHDQFRDEFNQLLNDHYNKSHIDIEYQGKLIEFIQDRCIIYQ